LAQGLSSSAIAAELGVDVDTVTKYASSILSKLHLADRTKAALYIFQKRRLK
jgi:NarL family two-component system response regulator LiaR